MTVTEIHAYLEAEVSQSLRRVLQHVGLYEFAGVETLASLWHEIHQRRSERQIDGTRFQRYLGMVKIIATDDWWQEYVESSMEVRSFFEEIEARGRAEGEARGRAEGEARGRAEGESQGQAKARAKLKSAALETVRIAAPAIFTELSELEDPEDILKQLGEYLQKQKG